MRTDPLYGKTGTISNGSTLVSNYLTMITIFLVEHAKEPWKMMQILLIKHAYSKVHHGLIPSVVRVYKHNSSNYNNFRYQMKFME